MANPIPKMRPKSATAINNKSEFLIFGASSK